MKHPIEKPSEQTMRFFTPELYRQYNSSDEEEADRANEEWEEAIQQYHRHLASIRSRMPPPVRKVGELCLHDAELLAFDQEVSLLGAVPPLNDVSPSLVTGATLSLRQDRQIVSLLYVLWDQIRLHPPRDDWPFSNLRKHWLYDEIDLAAENPNRFLHRILFSDGSEVEIPFVSVIPITVPLPEAERASVSW